MRPRKLGHKNPGDRFIAPLSPRRELIAALWNLAYYDTDRRRRRKRLPKVSILKVAIWTQASQPRVIAAYERHTRYLRDPRTLTRRTLQRDVILFKRLKLVSVTAPRRYDKRMRKWVREANVYAVTYRGKLWIKRHAGAVTNQLVV